MKKEQTSPLAELEYALVNSYIHNWLVVGPLATPITDVAHFSEANPKTQIATAYHKPELEVTTPPAEATSFQVDQNPQSFTWRAVQCLDDHFVDLTCFHHTCQHLKSWAYSEVNTPIAMQATLLLTTNGPADVWINGEHVHRQVHFAEQIPASVAFPAQLQAGKNRIMLRFEAVAARACPYVLALKIQAATDQVTVTGEGEYEYPESISPVTVTAATRADWRVTLPTTLRMPRRNHLMRCFEAAYLKKDVYQREDDVILYWPLEYPHRMPITVRLQTPAGRIYAEATPTVEAGSEVNLGKAYTRLEGTYEVVLLPPVEEYYHEQQAMKLTRRIPLYIASNTRNDVSEGSYAQRQQETLKDAAGRESNIYSEIAKITLGWWDLVKLTPFTQIITSINQRADCSDFYLVGLLGLLSRHGADPNFPPELHCQLEQCVLNFKYWLDEAGSDAMCYWTENHQILFHTCQLLAGQLYPEAIFSNVNQTGAYHREKGEQRALAWLRKRAAGGFRQWDSNVYFEHDVLALTHLADLATNDEVAEMAAIILDKLFYTLGLNSFKGVFGSTHGRSYAPYLKGGRRELTSGLARLLWGQGYLNEHILGSVALAASNYELPPILYQIGASLYEEVWSREQHTGELELWCDLAEGVWNVNKVTYKTPDFMLCSAQDYRPGQPGYQQHIWQATLSADAVVFTTHPPCNSEDHSHRPNFWQGNATLPRVAQWKDLLIAIYQLPADDWLGFTHAYFPQVAFDEVVINNVWVFGRQGDGYVALTAAQGIQSITSGYNAYRELRSYGENNIWVCQMGRAAVDGTFAEFQTRVLALPISFAGNGVQMQSLRRQRIEFGWTGDLLIDGQVEPISGFKHYDSPFCQCEVNAQAMDIQFFDQGMRLNLG